VARNATRDQITAVPGDGKPAYRIVSEESLSSGDAFRSNYDRRLRPRNAEQSSALVHFGVSMFVELARAQAMSRRFPMLGDLIVRVDLVGDEGTWYAFTGRTAGHITVWGRPEDLRRRMTRHIEA
jgi:hypothetical protein